MTLYGSDSLYIGIDQESFWDFWREGSALHVHLGTLRLEWDCRVRHRGPTQEPNHGPDHGATACCHGGAYGAEL